MNKYIPNILSLLRIISSFLLIVSLDNPKLFVIIYLIIGLTDILDGFTARKLNMESELGAKLDSAADFLFYMILLFIFIKYYSSFIVTFRFELAAIIFIRFLNLLLTKLKYKKIVFLHTTANKISGILLYFLAIIIYFINNYIIIRLIFIFIFLAALEELLITIKFSEINLNRRGLFYK